jgi:hypothetical protein
MLNPNTIFRKTDAGVAEVTTRKLGLRAELRRVLILVDGRSPVSKLATFVRMPEIDSLMYELQSLGLIDANDGSSISLAPMNPMTVSNGMSPMNAPTAIAAPAVARSHTPTPIVTTAAGTEGILEPTAEQFIAARTAAVRFLHDVLGPSADTLTIKLEKCKNAKDFREQVTSVRQSLGRILGENTANNFLEAVRSAAKL